MKFSIAGMEDKAAEGALLAAGFEKNDKKPDVVFCIGGDGTILLAERKFPGVPKVAVRRSKICKKCVFEEADVGKIIRSLTEKKYGIKEYMKLEGETGGKKLIALNEIQVHNASPEKAVRFSVCVNGKSLEEEIVGDGVVVATPYGSEAYYYSIGGEPFARGIGIGFNNPNKRIKARVVGEESIVEVTILRGSAKIIADNLGKFVPLAEGGKAMIKKSSGKARFVVWR